MLTNWYGKLNTFVVFIMLYFVATVLLQESLYSVALYVVLPCAFVLTMLQFGLTKVNKYFTIFVILYLWVLFTSLFTTNEELSFLQLKQMLGCVILSFIVASQSHNERNIPWLYIIYVIVYVVSIDYMVNNILVLIELGEERATDETLNANTLAYYSFYVTFIVFIFGEIINNVWLRKIFRLLFYVTIPLSLWVAYVTASRQVMIIQLPLIAILLFLRYWKYGNMKSKIFIVLLSCLAIPMLFKTIEPIFDDSLLMERAEEVEDDGRWLLIEESINLGLQNLFVGVGPGCVRLYTTERGFAHNTFLELFAGTGIVGMVIFIVLICKFIVIQIRRYTETKDKMYFYFLVFGIFFVIDQMFYVFYHNQYLISFFILVASHSEIYYNNRKVKTVIS